MRTKFEVMIDNSAGLTQGDHREMREFAEWLENNFRDITVKILIDYVVIRRN